MRCTGGVKKSGLSGILVAGALVLLLCSGRGLHAAETGVDAVTSASIDAETGASKQLDPIKISENFSVAYACNDNGAIFIVASDLTDAYQQDELASDSLFKGKDMIVKGEVEKTSKPDAAKPWLTLVGDANSGKKVRCALKKGQLENENIEAGRTIQIRGVCDGMKLSVSLVEGEIVD